MACGVATTAFAIYFVTLPPSYGMWDTAELQTVASILGIAHPPGSPVFALLGYAFVHVFPFGNDAWRVSIMCSLSSAASVGLAYLAARHFRVSQIASAVCAVGFAISIVTWRDATRAETLDVALLLRSLALVFGLRWYAKGNARDLFAMSLALGLACATHGLSLFAIPSLALLACARPEFYRRTPIVLAASGFVLGLLPYAYLPLRSMWIDAHHLEPLTALGLPPGEAFWNYGDPSTLRGFVRLVTASDFHVRGGFAGYLALARYPHFASALSRRVAQAFGWAGTVLALGGACLFVITRRIDGIAIVLAALLAVPYTESYTDLQDPDRYYLLTFWCAAVLIAAGFERLARLFELRPASLGAAVCAVALALSFSTTAPERADFVYQRDDRAGPRYVAEIRKLTPGNAIILADWAYATPLAYAAYVEHSLDRRVVVPSFPQQYLHEAARWVRTRPVYFVGFAEDLELPGWHTENVKSGLYSAYRLTK